MRVVLALAVVLASQPAFADEDPEPAHEGVAFALSFGATAASWGAVIGSATIDGNPKALGTVGTIGVLGTLVAPSAGHWYADRFLTRGFKARLIGAGAVSAGVLMVVGNCIGEHAECNNGATAAVLMIVGLGVYGYGTIHDIVTAPRSAREHNAEIAKTITVSPLVGGTATGLAIAGRW